VLLALATDMAHLTACLQVPGMRVSQLVVPSLSSMRLTNCLLPSAISEWLPQAQCATMLHD
jgi:hypothetical protein